MIYFIKPINSLHVVKIGYTGADDPSGRLTGIQVGNDSELHVFATIEGTHKQEKNLHRLLSDCHKRGEWFYMTRGVVLFLLLPAYWQKIILDSDSENLGYAIRDYVIEKVGSKEVFELLIKVAGVNQDMQATFSELGELSNKFDILPNGWVDDETQVYEGESSFRAFEYMTTAAQTTKPAPASREER